MPISYIRVIGGQLAADVHGEGPLVVCSPGMGDFRDAFAPLADHLAARGFRVASVDLRGHGDSSASFQEYGDEATAGDIATVIDALGGGPAVIAGASMSAAAAVIAAGRHPDKVSGLVLLGPYLRNGGGAMVRRLLHVALAKPWGPFVWRFYAAKLWPGLGEEAGKRAERSRASLTGRGAGRRFMPRPMSITMSWRHGSGASGLRCSS